MISLATIGRGKIVERAIEAAKRSDLYKLQACYSRELQKAKEFQAKHGFQKAYDNLEHLLADPEIEAIYIASPNALHYFQAKKALEAGKHVLCEKPLVESEEKARELFELAESRGLILLEAITTIHSSNFQKLKQALEKDEKVQEVFLQWCNVHPGYYQYLQGSLPNLFNVEMCGGVLMDLGIYSIHFALGLFGRPEKVIYQAERGRGGIDLNGTLTLLYPGFLLHSNIAIDQDRPFHFEIKTEKGLYEIKEGSIGRCNTITFKDKKSQKESILSQKPVHHMLLELQDFARLITEPQKYQSEREQWTAQSLKALSVLEEARKSLT